MVGSPPSSRPSPPGRTWIYSRPCWKKIALIAAHVQAQYTYKAIEFGRRARIPQRVSEIVRNKYGDCKDHAILTQQLLQAIGIPSTLALVSSTAPIRQDLPSLDQFDHMILHIPSAPGGGFLDCTLRNCDLAKLPTLGLDAHDALLLEPGHPRFLRIPPHVPDTAEIRVKRTAQLTNQTDMLVHETLSFDGVEGAYLRDYLQNQTKETRRSYLVGQFLTATAELLSHEITALDTPQRPVGIELDYLLRGQFQSVGNQIVGNPPLGLERAFLLPVAVEKKLLPFEITVPISLDATVEIRPPAGFVATGTIPPSQGPDDSYVQTSVATEQMGLQWRIASQVRQSPGRFPAGEYSNYVRAMQRTLDALNPRLTFEKKSP